MKEKKRNFNGKEIGVIVKRTGEWFVAKDVCDILGLANVSQAVESIPGKNKTTIYIRDSGSNYKHSALLVNEPGLYELVFKSKKEEARKFQEWVFEEVLPSIRKTGKYAILQKDRRQSIEARRGVADEWERVGGFSRPLDFIKATKHEYKLLFGDGGLKKEELDKRQIALLSMMETLERLDLSDCEDGAMSIHDAIHHMDDKPALLAPVMERLQLGGAA